MPWKKQKPASWRNVLAITALLAAATSAAAQHDASQMRLQLLNGKTGKPVVRLKVGLWAEDGIAGHKPTLIVKGVSDGEGFVAFPELPRMPQRVVVIPEAFLPCSKTSVRSFSYAGIASTGIVSENSCRPRISMYPQAGTLVFFIRPQTWLDHIRND